MKYKYIINATGKYVVPWAGNTKLKEQRDGHFTKAFGVRPLIVSPDFWEHLTSSYEIQTLTTEDK